MREWLDQLSQVAFEAGIGGLFALGVVDSAGVPTGGGPDVVVALLAALRPQRLYCTALVAAATIGSALGCLVLYGVGRRGGEAGKRRFDGPSVARVRGVVERRGAWLVFLSMLAPPPVPTKLFVLAAGLAALPRPGFLLATVLGRTVRYGLVATIALRYGPGALEAIGEGSARGAALLLAPAALVAVVYWLWQRYRAAG